MQSVQLISSVSVFLVPNKKFEAPHKSLTEIHLDTANRKLETGGLVHVWLMTDQPLRRSLGCWTCSLKGGRWNEWQGFSNLGGLILGFGDTVLICSIPPGASLLFSQQLGASQWPCLPSAIDRSSTSLFTIHGERWDPRSWCQQKDQGRVSAEDGSLSRLPRVSIRPRANSLSFKSVFPPCRVLGFKCRIFFKDNIKSSTYWHVITVPRILRDRFSVFEWRLWSPLCLGGPVYFSGESIDTNKVSLNPLRAHKLQKEIISSHTHAQTLAWGLAPIAVGFCANLCCGWTGIYL